MYTTPMTPLPLNEMGEVNPFHHDLYNMGTRIASNVIVMHSTHGAEEARSLYVVNTKTGDRMKVWLVPEKILAKNFGEVPGHLYHPTKDMEDCDHQWDQRDWGHSCSTCFASIIKEEPSA